jgi:hypothetical protein
VALAPRFGSGGSAAEGAAALGGELNAIATRHRVAIRRVDAGPDSTRGPFVRLEVRLVAESDFQGVYEFVQAV